MATQTGYGGPSGASNKKTLQMPSVNPQKINGSMMLTQDAQKKVLSFTQALITKHVQFNDIRNKFDRIDIAYARYQANKGATEADGVDAPASDVCCDVFAADDVIPPIVISQVDSYVAYLSEVYLSGSPIFPVVSEPSKRLYAEQLEALIDDHSSLGAYPRELLMFIRDSAKYNFAALECKWDAINQFSISDDIRDASQKLKKAPKKYNKLKRLNPRNVIWDWSLPPGDVSRDGDYAGYVERLSRTRLKRLFNQWNDEGKLYSKNVEACLWSSNGAVLGATQAFTEDPPISDYKQISTKNNSASPDWDVWFEPEKGSRRRGPVTTGAMYECLRIYARIMPADFGITAPAPNTPQIWEFYVVNNQFVMYAERVVSAYDYLPILFGQPLEDGLGYQTQSIAEGAIPFQKAAATLYNIRFSAARRAVSDRALYIPDMIKPSDVNSAIASPKIPVNISVLSQKGIQDAYHQIPFDMRGTETTLQDAALIASFAERLSGVNAPRQGMFQKGNKSVREWDDTMGGSDGRMRLPALTLEYQFFQPLKSIMVLNIFQYGEDGTVTSQVTGKNIEVKIAELRKAQMSFQMADGYTPKSKLANTDVLMAGMQFISNSPILQQAYGSSLPSMFAHFMSLSGLKGFEQYDPSYQDTQLQTALPVNNLQAPGTPTNGVPAQPVQVATPNPGAAPNVTNAVNGSTP
jgi:hypothetical protein